MSPGAHEPRLDMSPGAPQAHPATTGQVPLRLGNPLRNVLGGRDAGDVRYRVNRVTRNLG